MRRRPVAVLQPPEYPRPVIPSGLDEDQQDELLDHMMTVLLAGRSDFGYGAAEDVQVRVVGGGIWSLDDDIIEF